MATVDILMATYNGAKYIQEQIESIQAQTISDWRLFVSDDCSTDGTISIVEEIASSDSRIKIVSKGNRFGSAKLNFLHLLSYADSPYVMLCDQDDVWLNNKISEALTGIKKLELKFGSNEPCLFSTDLYVVDEDLNIVSRSFQHFTGLDSSDTKLNQILARNVVTGCTAIVNKALIKIAMIFPPNYYCVMHDWLLCLVAASFGQLSCSGCPQILYRQHGGNVAGAIKNDLLSKIGNVKFSINLVRSSIVQARSFLCVYEELLDVGDRVLFEEYASLPDVSLLQRLVIMSKWGLWKRNLSSRAMQFVSIVLLRLLDNEELI